MSLLRKLIIRFQPLPSQTAYTLLNYFVRSITDRLTDLRTPTNIFLK